MVVVSLALNLIVLVPVCWGMLRDAPWVRAAFGPQAPARGILTAVYVAILLASTALLVAWGVGFGGVAGPVAVLLTVQVVYKVLTPFTVGDLRNPVVLSNLGIAAVHAVTVVLLVGDLYSV